MRSYVQSLLYALAGLSHAFQTEKNLKLFTVLYVLSLAIAAGVQVRSRDWEVLIFGGGIFLSFELVNTALEHLTDAFDDHSKSTHAKAIKATKDIAAGASLVCAVAWGVITLMVFWPYAKTLLGLVGM